MEFSGLDLAAGRFTEMSTYIVSSSVLPESALKLAMARLVLAWPAITWRVNVLRYKAYESPAATSILDEMLHVRELLSEDVEQYLESSAMPSGITVRSCQSLASLFDFHKESWTDFFCPRIAAVQAVTFRNGTILKLCAQHVACDIVGLYNIAHAFCEGLRGHVEDRIAGSSVRYVLKPEIAPEKKGAKVSPGTATLKAMPARSKMPGIGYLPLAMKVIMDWFNWRDVHTKWQAIHVPESVLDRWREQARSASVSVSTFDLVATWVHMSLGDLAVQRGQPSQERTLINISLRPWFASPTVNTRSELWYPTAAVQIRPSTVHPTDSDECPSQHFDVAQNLRSQVHAMQNHDFAARVLGFVRSIGRSPITPQTSELMVVLSSFTHAPFDELSLDIGDDGASDILLVQHQLNYVRSIPTPWSASPVVAICRKDPGGGYWLEGNLSQALWDRMLNSRVLSPS